MNSRTRAFVGLGVVAIAVVLLWVLLSFDKTPREEIGIRYGGGPIEGLDLKG